jgi:hypothetical protein
VTQPVQVRIDFQGLADGAERIAQAAGEFGRHSGYVNGIPPLAAPSATATSALERVRDALFTALRSAEQELAAHADALRATAASYQQADEMLANWHVPGGGA